MLENLVVVNGRASYFRENTTKTGKKVAGFSLGVPNPGQKAGFSYVNVTAWDLHARTSELLAKGWEGNVLVTGRLKTESWEGKNGKRTEVKVVASEVCLLAAKPKKEQFDPDLVSDRSKNNEPAPILVNKIEENSVVPASVKVENDSPPFSEPEPPEIPSFEPELPF